MYTQDEYEKKHDFYDEYYEDGEHEKHGGYHHEHEGKKGGHEKKGHTDSARREVCQQINFTNILLYILYHISKIS